MITTPLPKVKSFTVGSIVLVNDFCSTLIYPFLPFMIHDFFPNFSRHELGDKSGYLAGSFYAGYFFGCLLWGKVSDLWGRKPVLLLGLSSTIVSIILFGFSQNFLWAVTARFLSGFLNGNNGVAKSYISEICDDTNQAQGFAVLGTFSGIGRILGSVVGGYLAQPASKYPFFQHEFFCQFPYVLPVFVAVAVGIFSLLAGFCFIDETVGKFKQPVELNLNDEQPFDEYYDEGNIQLSNNIEMVSLISNEMYYRKGLTSSNKDELTNHKNLCIRLFHHTVVPGVRNIANLLTDRRIIVSSTVYGFFGSLVVLMFELFPLLMVTDHVHGGFEMDDNEIATFIMIVAIIQLFYQPFIFPRLAKLLGYRNLLRVSLLLFATGCILLPWSNSITGPIINSVNEGATEGSGIVNDTFDYCGQSTRLSESSVNENSIDRIPARVWTVVLLSLTLIMITSENVYTSIAVMINNSAFPETRGSVNGIAQSLVAISRAISPVVGSVLLSWTERNDLEWPLNFHFSFILTAIMATNICLYSLLLPKSIEGKRQRFDDVTNT